jgi:hypothetical protein
MIHYRLARPDDIPTCVQFIADHPVLRPRYGAAIEHLGTVWRRFLGSDALFSIVSEESGSGRATSGRTKAVLLKAAAKRLVACLAMCSRDSRGCPTHSRCLRMSLNLGPPAGFSARRGEALRDAGADRQATVVSSVFHGRRCGLLLLSRR